MLYTAEQIQECPEWQWSGRKRPPSVLLGVLSDPGGSSWHSTSMPRSSLPLCCNRDGELEPVPPAEPPSTHRSPLVTSCSCQAPLLCCKILQPFRVVRCPTEVMTFIPSSSLGYGNGSYDYGPFCTLLFTKLSVFATPVVWCDPVSSFYLQPADAQLCFS